MVRELEKLDEDVSSNVDELVTVCDNDDDFDFDNCCDIVKVGESRLGEIDGVSEYEGVRDIV